MTDSEENESLSLENDHDYEITKTDSFTYDMREINSNKYLKKTIKKKKNTTLPIFFKNKNKLTNTPSIDFNCKYKGKDESILSETYHNKKKLQKLIEDECLTIIAKLICAERQKLMAENCQENEIYTIKNLKKTLLLKNSKNSLIKNRNNPYCNYYKIDGCYFYKEDIISLINRYKNNLISTNYPEMDYCKINGRYYNKLNLIRLLKKYNIKSINPNIEQLNNNNNLCLSTNNVNDEKCNNLFIITAHNKFSLNLLSLSHPMPFLSSSIDVNNESCLSSGEKRFIMH